MSSALRGRNWRRTSLALVGLLGADWLGVGAAHAADVKVRIDGVNSQGGTMRVQVCTRETFLKDCPYKAKAPSHRGSMFVVVNNVPPGTYAVVVHHDINNNGIVDRTLFGVPKEGVGFSRSPLLVMRAPTFDEVSVPVSEPLVEVDITLKFEP